MTTASSAATTIALHIENRQCFDCHNRNPTWLSVSYGLFLCLTCSGTHRRMGTHISFVRSCELDKFTPDQLMRMELGGNGRALTYFKTHGSAKPDYHSKLAAKYKAILDKACQASVASGDSPLDSVDSPTLIAAEPVPTKAAPVPTIANILPRPELPPPISKASGVSRAAPQPQYCDGRVGSGLGHALMAHASATGGIGGAKSMRAKKLDFDFDFDEAIEEATAPSSAEHIQTDFYSPTTEVKTCSPTVNSASIDATIGLSPIGLQHSQQRQQPTPVVNGAVANSKYSNAKAISSVDLFGGPAGQQTAAERLEMDARVRRFNDCKGISSDAFHAGDPTLVGNNVNTDNESSAQFSQLSDQAVQGIQVLTNGAQQTVSKARDWLNNFIFEERSGGGSSMFR